MPNLPSYRPSVRKSIPRDARLQVWINGKKVSRQVVDRDVAAGLSLRRSLFKVFQLPADQYKGFAEMFAERAKLFKSGRNYKLVLNFEPVVVHVSGPSGVGKTTLGRHLKSEFGDQIVVKDLDDLRAEFIAARYHGEPFSVFDKESFQAYVDNFVTSRQFRPLVLVGLNEMPRHQRGQVYNVHATHKYYVTLDDETVVQQKCKRFLSGLANSKSDMEFLVERNDKYLTNVGRALQDECGLEQTIAMNAEWAKSHESQGYEFVPRKDIGRVVSDVLNQEI